MQFVGCKHRDSFTEELMQGVRTYVCMYVCVYICIVKSQENHVIYHVGSFESLNVHLPIFFHSRCSVIRTLQTYVCTYALCDRTPTYVCVFTFGLLSGMECVPGGCCKYVCMYSKH